MIFNEDHLKSNYLYQLIGLSKRRDHCRLKVASVVTKDVDAEERKRKSLTTLSIHNILTPVTRQVRITLT